jgi:hypothetical protein
MSREIRSFIAEVTYTHIAALRKSVSDVKYHRYLGASPRYYFLLQVGRFKQKPPRQKGIVFFVGLMTRRGNLNDVDVRLCAAFTNQNDC